MVDNAIIQSKVNVSNKNELDFIANSTGDEHIENKIDKHDDKLINKVVSQEENGKLDSMVRSIRTGEGLSLREHEDLEKIAETLSPAELKRLAEAGRISEENANFLIMADSLKDAGLSGDAKGRALENFFGMKPEVQKFCVDQMSDRTSERHVKVEKAAGMFGLIRADEIKFREKEAPLSPAQERLALFLSVPRNRPGDIQNFMAGDFDSSRDALTAALGDLPTFRVLEPDQQTDLIDLFHELGTGGGMKPPHPGLGGPRPDGTPGVTTMGPEDFEKMGFKPNEIVDLATLMFQVLADRISTLDQQVRVYAEGVQDKNNELKTLNNAMTVIRTETSGEKKSDLSEVEFSNAQGKSVKLADYLMDAKVITDPEKLEKIGGIELDSMLSSLKSKSDILSSESTEAMTKLQQAMDKYNQSTTTQTNVESKFNSLKMGINSKLGQ